MAITSLIFLGFCIAAVVLFALFPKKYRWISLLISSVAFYLISARAVIVYILLTSLTVWLASRLLDRIRLRSEDDLKVAADREAKKAIRAGAARARKTVLVSTLVLNLGILIALKIFNYFTGAFAMLVGIFTGGTSDAVRLIMPLGISYYTFAAVGYLLDIYWKRYDSEKNFARFLLFAIYFPHIVQGPISRYPQLGRSLSKPVLELKWDNFVVGLELILLGCFKKLVIADRAAVFVAATLNERGMSGFIYVVAMVLDAIQIYTDFSGYTDIVRGVSRIFDVELEQNFNHPFFAKSVPEFWRRWHMSLGSWFKDYVYYPVSLSKGVKKLNRTAQSWKYPHLKTAAAVIIPIFATWVLTGLWHGTGYGYVLWGLYYSSLITLSVTFSDDVQKLLGKLHVRTEVFSYRVFQTLKIFAIFMGGRFLGSTMSLGHRKYIISHILGKFMSFDLYSHGLDRTNFGILTLGLALLVAIGVIESKEEITTWFNRQNRIFCAIVIYVLFFAVFLLGIYGTTYSTGNFMYQQF